MAERILIVDDDPELTRALAVRLGHAGFDVAVANDADTAVALAQRHRPQAILLDIDMPHYTGLEFHECLQFGARTRCVPVVYISGHDCALFRQLAFERGARAFVAKPYDTVQLVQLLRDLLAPDVARA